MERKSCYIRSFQEPVCSNILSPVVVTVKCSNQNIKKKQSAFIEWRLHILFIAVEYHYRSYNRRWAYLLGPFWCLVFNKFYQLLAMIPSTPNTNDTGSVSQLPHLAHSENFMDVLTILKAKSWIWDRGFQARQDLAHRWKKAETQRIRWL